MEDEELQEKIAELRAKRGGERPPEERLREEKKREGDSSDFRAGYRGGRRSEPRDVFAPEDEDAPPAKEDSVWGALTFQAILALLVAIAFVLLSTFAPEIAGNAVVLVRDKEQNDFSFRGQVYDTVGQVISYLNGLNILPDALDGAPGAESAPVSEDGANAANASQEGGPSSSQEETPSNPAGTSSAPPDGQGGPFTPVEGSLVPQNCTFAPVVYTGAALFPLPEWSRVTSEFGFRDHPVKGEAEFHTAVDLAAAQGTKVLAAFDGTVLKSGYDAELGNYIRLDHGNDFITTYAHCDSLTAKEGMRVRQGEVIARVGSTGDSTGYHLHFAARLEGYYFNPAWLFPKELNVSL